jgi:predicted dehydrogenase
MCRLVSVHDLDERRALELARDLGCEVAPSLEAVLTDPDVDVVSIASYDDAHYEQTLAALRAGKHVFVEKPLCRTAAELRTLRAVCHEFPQLRIGSNLVLRAAPLYRHLHEQCAAGRLGRLYAFDGDYLYGRLGKITDGWRRDVSDYSVMLGGGVHLVDLMLLLTGEQPRAVSAVGNRISTEDSGFRYDDFVAATFRFDSGLVGRITANYGSVQPHRHVVRLFGTEATVVVDDAGARVYRTRDPETAAEPIVLPAEPASKGALIPNFVRSVVDGAPLCPGAEHEFAVISACIAADEALAKGGEVDVDYE